MLSREDNERLTLTGPGTPMGQLFRRFWMPVALAEEAAVPDGPPKRLTVLGEDLLLFRQSDGRVGLVEPRCAHRGADLYFGRNEECGLRCVYHGWKFDADGKCLDIPNMQPGRTRDNIMKRARIKAYPTREWGGQIWAYLGPAETMPPLPMVEWALVDDGARYCSKKLQECNWAQSLEGAIDTSHFSFAHRVFGPEAPGKAVYADKRAEWINNDGAPRYEVLEHDAGLVLAGGRRADPGETYWRISQFMIPNHSIAPGAMPGETFTAQSWVPIDDETCWIYTTAWNPERPLSDDELERYRGGRSVHAMVDGNYVPLRNRGNEYLMDRELQHTHNFTGITGLSEQDACIQDSQGRIADRTREILTPSDEGVVRFRRLMLGLARDLEAGRAPAAAGRPEAYSVRAGGVVTSATLTLREAMKLRFGHETGWAEDLLQKAAE